MKTVKRFFTVIVMVVVFVAGFAVGDALNLNLIGKNDTGVTTEEFKAKLIEVSEMASLDYDYDGTFKYDGGSLKFLNKDIPFTDKSMTVHYKGVIKLGTDMEKADIDFNAMGNKVTITVPHCKILSHEIDEKSYQVVDKDNGLFNRVKIEDDAEFRKLQKKETENELKASVYEEADENLEKQLIGFFGFGYPDLKVEVEFK